MTFASKIFTIVLIVTLTVAYSLYEKSRIDALESAGKLVLQELPDINLADIEGKTNFTKKNLIDKDTRGLVVHFWGTWCAPCEAELPGFIQLADRLQVLGVKFLLIAVNDDVKKIKKFMKRFKNLPENVYLANDPSGDSMPVFGTAKVPETYLFARDGKHLNKFVGPQEWEMASYFDRIRRLVDDSLGGKDQAVETH